MEITVILDSVTTIDRNYTRTPRFTNCVTRQLNFTKIRSQILPIDAVAPQSVKSSTIPKRHTGKRSRVKRKRKTNGFSADEGGADGGFFGGGDGNFGGGVGGGGFFGGGGGSFDGFNWDESSPWPSDPAFDIVYAALSWFVLSNCLHFAFKRVVRIVVDGAADTGDRRLR